MLYTFASTIMLDVALTRCWIKTQTRCLFGNKAAYYIADLHAFDKISSTSKTGVLPLVRARNQMNLYATT